MISNKITQTSTGIQQSVSSSVPASVSSNPSSVNSTAGLEKGQLIRGEITDLRNNEVSVKLEDGRILNGKLEDASTLAIGDKVVFKVEDVSFKNLTLKIMAVSDNAAQEYTVDKALEAAGLSKNVRNREIVKELLNQQMSIDKKTISLLIKESLQNKDSSIATLVSLNKYHIPVTPGNVTQFEAYRNADHQIMKEAVNLTDAITDLFTEETGLEDSDYKTFSKSILSVFLEQTAFDGEPVSKPATASPFVPEGSLTLKQTAPDIGTVLSIQESLKLSAFLENNPAAKEILGKELITAIGNGTANLADTAKALLSLMNQAATENGNPVFISQLQDSNTVQAIITASQDLSADSNTVINLSGFLERMHLSSLFDNFVSSIGTLPPQEEKILLNIKADLNTGLINKEQLLGFIHSHLEDASGPSVKALLSSEEWKAVLKEDILSKWTLAPDDLTKTDMNKHYESILQQLDKVRENIEQSGSNNTQNLQGQLSHFSDNVHFMSTLNQFMGYLQLPLKLKQQFTNSELHVYSKKGGSRNLSDGISVLLHLDMDHLGPLDIYVEMQGNHLSSKFYLDNETAMNLISSHIYLLGAVLELKGYTLNTEILPREKKVNVIEDFIMEESSKTSPIRYNFDLRA